MIEIEHDAAEMVVRALGALRAERRDKGGEQTRDFDLVFDDGHEEPLEITLDAQEAVVQTWDRLDRANSLDADLERYWMLSPGIYDREGRGSLVDVRELRAFAIEPLQEFERQGIHSFDTTRLWFSESFRPAAQRLTAYGNSPRELDRDSPGARRPPTASPRIDTRWDH